MLLILDMQNKNKVCHLMIKYFMENHNPLNLLPDNYTNK